MVLFRCAAYVGSILGLKQPESSSWKYYFSQISRFAVNLNENMVFTMVLPLYFSKKSSNCHAKCPKHGKTMVLFASILSLSSTQTDQFIGRVSKPAFGYQTPYQRGFWPKHGKTMVLLACFVSVFNPNWLIHRLCLKTCIWISDSIRIRSVLGFMMHRHAV